MSTSLASSNSSTTLAKPIDPVITRIDDRFVSIRRGSVSEVVFSPIRPGITLFGSAPPAPVSKPATASPAPAVAITPASTPAVTPVAVTSKPASTVPVSTDIPPLTPPSAIISKPVIAPPVTPYTPPIIAPPITPGAPAMPVASSAPPLTPTPAASTAPAMPPASTSTANQTPAPAPADTAPPVDLIAQANVARYQDNFYAPAPFGDEAPKSKKDKPAVAAKFLSLDEDTDDLSLESSLSGIGNGLDNRLTGNEQNNILDGMGGADTMIGGKGDDSYYVDNAGDKIVEQAGEGVDTLYATASTTLAANVENLVLLDASKPQSAVVNGVNVLVYGMPRSYQLDYDQGGEVDGYWGTCGETSVANVTLMGGHAASEKEVVQRAIKENLCDTAAESADMRGATSEDDRQALLQDFGFASTIDEQVDLKAVAQSIKDGKGVIISVSASKLWDLHEDNEQYSDHAITVTGVACSAASGKIVGFYIADSGRGLSSDMCRFVTLQRLREATNVYGADTVTTDAPIKLANQNLDATGNALDNILVGNRGNNVLTGGKGNDLLIGGAGNDSYAFAKGDGQDVLYDHDATKGNLDTLTFSDAKQSNLWFRKAGNDLRIDVMGATDQVLVKDWYVGGDSGSDHHVERIKTADGKTLYDSDVDKLVQAMASFAPPAATQTSWPTTQGGNGKVLLTISH
ncbi:calcium-binding protein [Herbaspirillum rubrisubalbicans]|uniref:calcium-binding protein n=1 Tax=Herbaspirillum rubrisubalbicans TaxID=80842 RepID=UPI001ED9A213|nr:calcium-binding protein [Herbaspirillum rubrisubalbicans]